MVYEYTCRSCGLETTRHSSIEERNKPAFCERCGEPLTRVVSAVYGRIAGRTLQGGGPDRFTADVLGISDLRDLPEGLKTK